MRRLLALLLAVVSAAGCSFQTLGAPQGHLKLYAIFDDVQNLVVGHGVQMYDVRVGSVMGITLQGYRAKVTLSIVDGTRVPVGTTATIAQTSLLGENFVRLTPPAGAVPRTSPALATGSVITSTGVQPGLEQISERVGPILAALTGENLDEMVNGLATGLDGAGPRLRQLVQEAGAVSASYAAASQNLADLIDGMGRLSAGLAKHSAALDHLPGDLLTVTQRVQNDRAALKKALTGLSQLAESADAIIKEKHGARLKALLDRLNNVLAAIIRGKDQLKTVTHVMLTQLMQTPHITHQGQVLAYAYIGGLLPSTSSSTTTTTAKSGLPEQLRKLLGPGTS